MSRSPLADLEAALPDLRPELHRYTARMTGSVIEGEDVLQDVLAAAVQAISAGTEPEHLRGWLFRIAHNTALNHIRRRQREIPMADDIPEQAAEPSPADPTEALSAFVPLTPQQRSTVILRDVMGYTAPEVADLTDTTIAQVKSSLHRGRAALRRGHDSAQPLNASDRARLASYTELFNAQAFDQLREMLIDEARLEVVARETRVGALAVGRYFTNYSRTDDWWLEPGIVEGRPSALVFDRADPQPAPRYFVLLDFEGPSIASIRDFRYASYVMTDAKWHSLTTEKPPPTDSRSL